MTETITDEQKQTVLDLIRAGRDRQQAAEAIGTTATQLKRMCNPTAHRYDPDFAAAYEQALAERDPNYYYNERPRTVINGTPMKTTPRGFTRWMYLTDDDKATFLEMVTIGVPNELAASEIHTSLHQIRLLARNDHDFGHAYQDALAEGQPHFHELLRAEYFKQALKEHNLQALRDLAIVHLPEFEKLRTSKHELSGPGGAPIQVLQAVIKDLPPHIRDALIEHEKAKLEQGKKELPAVIDSDEAA